MTISKINEYISYMVILSLALGQFGRIPMGGYVVGVYIWDIFIATYVVLFVAHKYIFNGLNKNMHVPSFYVYMLLFVLWATIGIVNGYRFVDSLPEFLVSVSYLVRFVVYMVFAFGIYQEFINSKKYRKTMLFVISGLGLLISILGFAQLLVFPDLGKLDPSLLWTRTRVG